MKKLLSLFAALAITASAIPSVTAFAAEDDTKSEAVDHLSKTVTIGDVNNSGAIDIGDLVKASRFFLGEDVEDLSSMLLDVNLDGENDIFDLIELRKLLIDPESGKVQEYIMDLVKSQVRLNSDSIKLEDAEEAAAYFEEILSDSEEIKKFTELYDEEFFEDNVLILRSLVQKDLDSIIYDFADIDYNALTKQLEIALSNDDPDGTGVNGDYSFGSILTQISLPKEMSDMIDDLSVISQETLSLFEDFDFMKLISPDGEHELNLIDNAGDLILYMYNDEELCDKLISDCDADIFDFYKTGDWSVDENGKTIFTDPDGNKVSWGNGFADLTFEGIDGTTEQFEVGYPSIENFGEHFNLEDILDGWEELLNF